MARPGYIEARGAYYDAQMDVLKAEADLELITTNPPEHLTVYVLEQEIKRCGKTLEQAKIDLETAKAAFDTFNAVEPKPDRKYFETKIGVCLSLNHDMQLAINTRRTKDGMSLAELIRRALALYLGELGDNQDKQQG